MKEIKKGEVVIFKSKEGPAIDVRLKEESVWLSLDQMSDLFERDKSVISRHIKNVFSENELVRHSVVANFATTASDGKNYNIDYYNLDVIISIGYRVKSPNGVRFRIWATKTLKEHLVKGYTVNEKRLQSAQKNLLELTETIEYLKEKSKHESMIGQLYISSSQFSSSGNRRPDSVQNKPKLFAVRYSK